MIRHIEYGSVMIMKELRKKYDFKKLIIIICVATFLGATFSSPVIASDEKVSTAQDQESIKITIYNDNLALVKDARKILFDRNVNRLAWRDVSAQIRPETALLRNLTNPSQFRLLEQNFDFDLLTPTKLLEKYAGKEITVIRTNAATGVESSETATVLSTNEGVVLKFSDRIEAGVPGRLVFPGVPENLRDKPTLLVSLLNPSEGQQDLELSYLTHGLSWHADYVAALNETDSLLDLNGFVTLSNQSGIAYYNAGLQLVAGDVNRAQPEQRSARKMIAVASEMADVSQMREEALFEYHLYTLQHPTTLLNKQTKQIALLSATNIPLTKEYLLQGADYYYSGRHDTISQKQKISVFINVHNKGDGLGIPLPKGIIRVYKKDLNGNSQFVGEDHIDHVPNNELIRLKMGSAFDITADKVQTDFKQIAGTMRHASIFETAYQITLKNAKKEAITVKVREPIPGDWEVISESLSHTKLGASWLEWKVPVSAESEAKLTYLVRVKY